MPVTVRGEPCTLTTPSREERRQLKMGSVEGWTLRGALASVPEPEDDVDARDQPRPSGKHAKN